MTASSVNPEAFQRIATGFDRQRQLWNQDDFITVDEAAAEDGICSSACCVAGMVLFEYDPDEYHKQVKIKWQDIHGKWTELHRESWNSQHYSEYARRILGLNEYDADQLFAAGKGPADGMTVGQALRAIAGGAKIEDVWMIRKEYRDL